MENDINQNVDSLTAGFGIAASVAILFSTILTVAKESTPSLLTWMKTVTMHHWITHGFLVVGLFIILGLLLSRMNIQIRATALTWMIFISSALGGLGIVGYFLLA